SMRILDLEDLVPFDFPQDDDYVTLAGLFYKFFGSVPNVGDMVRLEGGQLTVREMDNHRITLLLFEDTAIAPDGSTRLAESTSAAEEEHGLLHRLRHGSSDPD
ncbi:MAG TPA: transporter associated domain-containing protein, partial [Propionibacteriaceae bacterium]|nr:transporter associated domain-containing protein [Propionibacteriaceae bacterium]